MQAHRWKKEGLYDTLELFIHWQGQPPEEATWKSYDLLKSTFSFFPLEDKAVFRAEVMIDLQSSLHIEGRSGIRKTSIISLFVLFPIWFVSFRVIFIFLVYYNLPCL